MKKIMFVAASAALLSGFSSCTKTPKVELKNEIDSLSYSVGVLNCDPRMKMALKDQLELDSTNYDAFIKGFLEGSKCVNKDEIAKAIGFQIGMQHSDKSLKQAAQYFFQGDSTASLNGDAVIAGYIATFKNQDVKIDMETAREFMQNFQRKQHEENMAKQYADWKKENEEFLANNAKNEGVKVTESGLQYKIISEGKGSIATDTTKLKVTYTGKLIDGTVFDSSIKEDQKTKAKTNNPFSCTPSSGIIKGWQEILKTLPIGTKCTVYIPAELGYGAQNTGKIKPFSTLIFDMEIAE